ncbi:hypothetical protein CEXT_541871 [Caerostris extrusa]|uniref:Uncharacterized protein n=1 Tax=Caerostris extrusa TaxID=172846 RepID=A0AAV4U1X1_CAEEX|nr:hypothetical protein CEXT_541871 [Caerostris extrusa]
MAPKCLFGNSRSISSANRISTKKEKRAQAEDSPDTCNKANQKARKRCLYITPRPIFLHVKGVSCGTVSGHCRGIERLALIHRGGKNGEKTGAEKGKSGTYRRVLLHGDRGVGEDSGCHLGRGMVGSSGEDHSARGGGGHFSRADR